MHAAATVVHDLTYRRAAHPQVAADWFLREYGLGGYMGGRHQGGWGTENWLVPLGAGYLEIAAVWDAEAAQSCDWGK